MPKNFRLFYALPYFAAFTGCFGTMIVLLVIICAIEAYLQHREHRAEMAELHAKFADWNEEDELGNDYPWKEDTEEDAT